MIGFVIGVTVGFWSTVWLLSLTQKPTPFHEAVREAENILHDAHTRKLRR